MTAKEHYDNLLADFYEWMSGDFDIKQADQKTFFQQHNILPEGNKIAVDLGAGHGLQSIPLSNLGFSVNAFDFNKKLLNDLSQRASNLDIKIIESDIIHLNKFVEKAELIVCMGDTISHLGSPEIFQLLVQKCFKTLEDKGKLILSFRDYSVELKDTKRIIPVKSDNEKILTCILEYFSDTVRVTDLLYQKSNAGWEFKASSYFKLRISAERISSIVSETGFKISSTEMINGMIYLIASK